MIFVINAVLRVVILTNDALGSSSTFVVVNRCCRVTCCLCGRIKWLEGTILFLIGRPSSETINQSVSSSSPIL